MWVRAAVRVRPRGSDEEADPAIECVAERESV